MRAMRVFYTDLSFSSSNNAFRPFSKKTLDNTYCVCTIYCMLKNETIIIKGVPADVKRAFKVHCAEISITMKEGILRLMQMDVEGRLLAQPIKKKRRLKK